ncbi:MAG: hypothetical protein KAX55_00455 [Propionivibrio sp.]|nr:hypothetical protein [Propionivibrio sp.]
MALQSDRIGTIRTVAYHGTPVRFDRFRVSELDGVHFGSLDQASHRLCTLVAKLPLPQFEKLPLLKGGQPGFMVKAAIRLDRPLRVDDQQTEARWRRVIAKAKAEGYDGLVYRNEYEMPHSEGDSYVVFSESQIGAISFPFNDPADVKGIAVDREVLRHGDLVFTERTTNPQYKRVIGTVEYVKRGVVCLRLQHVQRSWGNDGHGRSDKGFVQAIYATRAIYTEAPVSAVEKIDVTRRAELLADPERALACDSGPETERVVELDGERIKVRVIDGELGKVVEYRDADTDELIMSSDPVTADDATQIDIEDLGMEYLRDEANRYEAYFSQCGR